MFSPAPPSSVNRLPVSVMWSAAVKETLACGSVSRPHGHVPAGFENEHMPWLSAPVMCRLLCTSAKPVGADGAFQVA